MGLWYRLVTSAAKKMLPRYEYYAKQVIGNKLNRLLKPVVHNTYVFILSAPLCGSTLLHEILSTSPNVSVNNNWATREGQKLPTTRKLMYDNVDRWNENTSLNWELIMHEWRKYWDVTKPVLLEKSPPNLVRAKQIAEVFKPSFFIVLVRNPYAQCEGLMRRQGLPASEAATLVMQRMKLQQKNLHNLQNTLLVRYEDLCDATDLVENKIVAFVPDFSRFDTKKRFTSHNIQGTNLPITNLNTVKISSLSAANLQVINLIFKREHALLTYFNYLLQE